MQIFFKEDAAGLNKAVSRLNMKCPFCSHLESKVIDSRPTDEGERIRRRRECLKCFKRFTTYEIVETTPIMVIKKDKRREPFDREKLMTGLMKACEKRPISTQVLENVADDIQTIIQNKLDKEVSSSHIGELAMEHLKKLDKIAYVRFASVYRQFSDIETLADEINQMRNDD